MTTDVAVHDIDIDGLTRVVNFSVPRVPEYCVHRLECAGRVGKKGTAITLFLERSIGKFGDIGVVEMLLNELMRDKVDRNKSGEIEKFGFSERNDERIRLFVTVCSADGLDARKIVALLEERNGVEASSVTNVDKCTYF